MSTKLNLPKTLGSDFAKLSELAVKYNRTTTGNTSYVSPSSSVTYNTAGSAYDGTGEDGLFALLQTALEDYIVLAADFNTKIDTGALSDTDIAVDDSGFDTLTGADQGAINADIDAILTADAIDYARNPGYATTGGSPTAYTITLTPAPTAYATGMRVAIKLHVDCGAAPTVNVNSLGAKTMLKNGDTAIIASEYKQNMVLSCIYDGTNFLIDPVDYAGETLTTQGDMLYRDSSGLQRLAKGTARQQVIMNSGATAPEWGASLQSTMTATGDVVYASGANTPARLAVGSTGQVLGVSGGVPVWENPEWVLMETQTTASSATSVTFSTLGSYDVFKIVIMGCFDSGEDMLLRFNADSTNKYKWTKKGTSAGSASSETNSGGSPVSAININTFFGGSSLKNGNYMELLILPVIETNLYITTRSKNLYLGGSYLESTGVYEPASSTPLSSISLLRSSTSVFKDGTKIALYGNKLMV